MPYVITQNCCNDAACVPVCPVNCIHPTPDEPEYLTSEMLYIDPDVCIECGVCMDVCPVKAIAPDYELSAAQEPFVEVNAQWYADPAHRGYPQEPAARPTQAVVEHEGPVRVAVVGSGPAACYAVDELANLRGLDAEITVFERLPAPGGLVRYGVAPDHQATKDVADVFGRVLRRPGVSVLLNVEVGQDVTHEQLLAAHHAVIYAVGAPSDRRMGVPGEDLRGCHPATELVAWYNGHPDFAEHKFDLSTERAVVVGNGNVAIDVARILTADVDRLRRTDIAAHALEQLADSRIREVVVLGRRGPAQASFTVAELIGLINTDGVDVHARAEEIELDDVTIGLHRGRVHDLGMHKVETLRSLTSDHSFPRRVELRFLVSPDQILGDERVTGIRLMRNAIELRGGSAAAVSTGEYEQLDCGLVFRSVGYRGRPVPGLPFDEVRGVVPNQSGRVVDDDPESPVPHLGVYVVGWAKRGPSGVIGTNKRCAQETVRALLDDLAARLLSEPTTDAKQLHSQLTAAGAIDLAGWRSIDETERALGRAQSRPRVKFASRKALLDAARA